MRISRRGRSRQRGFTYLDTLLSLLFVSLFLVPVAIYMGSSLKRIADISAGVAEKLEELYEEKRSVPVYYTLSESKE